MGAAAEKLAAGDRFSSAKVSIETQLAVERFLYRQAKSSTKTVGRWLTLFTEDGHYWMPVSEDQPDGEGVPNIFWEDLNLMKMRIRRNNHPQAHSQAPPPALPCRLQRHRRIRGCQRRHRRALTLPLRGYLRYGIRSFTGRYRHYLKKCGWLPDRPPAGRSGQPRGALRIRHPVVAVTPPFRSVDDRCRSGARRAQRFRPKHRQGRRRRRTHRDGRHAFPLPSPTATSISATPSRSC